MIKKTAISIAAFLAATGNALASEAFFATGEHGDYSRVVLSAGAGEPQIVQNGRTVTIGLSLPVENVHIDQLVGGQRTDRVRTAQVFPTSTGSIVVLELNCDCEITNSALANGKTIIDVAEAGVTPPNAIPDANPDAAPKETAAAGPTPLTPSLPSAPSALTRKLAEVSVEQKPTPKPAPKPASTTSSKPPALENDALSVESARTRMIDLLQRAANEGLISLRDDAASGGLEAPKPAQETPVDLAENDHQEPEKTDLDEHSKPQRPKNALPYQPNKPVGITKASTAKTLADQIKVREPEPYLTEKEKILKSNSPDAMPCVDDDMFALDGSPFEEDPLGAIAELQNQLANSILEEQRQSADALAGGFLAIGFGEEALALLRDHQLGNTIRADMARILADMPLNPRGKILGVDTCFDSHALWQALADAPEKTAELVERSDEAIDTLPTRLKTLVATQTGQKACGRSVVETSQKALHRCR